LQLTAQAVIACGRIETNAADPVTSKPMTNVSAKTLSNIAPSNIAPDVPMAGGRIVNDVRRH
jgi:hypothetical protein